MWIGGPPSNRPVRRYRDPPGTSRWPGPISLWPGNKVDVTWTRHFEYMGDIVKSVAENTPAHWNVRHAPIRQTFLDLGLNIADYVSIDGLHINTRGQAFVADRVIETAFS